MHKRLSMFDKIMAAVTFAEANEHATARELAHDNGHADQNGWRQACGDVAVDAKTGGKSARAGS